MFGAVKRLGGNLFGGVLDGQPGMFSQHQGGLPGLLSTFVDGRPGNAVTGPRPVLQTPQSSGSTEPADAWAEMVRLAETSAAQRSAPIGKSVKPQAPAEDRPQKKGPGFGRVLERYLTGDGTWSQSRDAVEAEDMGRQIAADPSLSLEDRLIARADPVAFAQARKSARAATAYGEDLAERLGIRRPQAPDYAPAASDFAGAAPAVTAERPTLDTMAGGDVDWPTAQGSAPEPFTGRYSPADIDAMVRTVWGEARNQGAEGQQGVAAVIDNRARQAGMSPRDVVMAPRQFSPWGDPRVRAQMEALDPNSPEYQAIRETIMPVLAGEDPTGGADHFYNPELASPSWGQGPGEMIGEHKFMRLGYSGAGAPRSAPQASDAAENVADTAPGYAPAPARPQVTGAPMSALGPTEGERAMIEAGLASQDPTIRDAAIKQMERIQQRMFAPVEWKSATVNGLPARFNEATGQYELVEVPGARTQTFVAQPGNQWGLVPGTTYSVKPNGDVSVLERPETGYEEVGGGLRPRQGGSAMISGEKELRTEYRKATGDYREARNGYEKVVTAAQDGTGASDIALIFGFMKTLDPSSTVREGEFATAQNSGSVDQTVVNLYNRALKGERLTPEQRRQFATTARRQFGVYESSARSTNEHFASLAEQYGFDPDRVVQPLRPVTDPSAKRPAAFSKATDAQWRKAQQFSGSKAQAGTQGNPYVPDTRAEYDALPAGAWYIASDGSVGQKRSPASQQRPTTPPPAAVAELKSDPSPAARREFDEVFGAGAAARALGAR